MQGTHRSPHGDRNQAGVLTPKGTTVVAQEGPQSGGQTLTLNPAPSTVASSPGAQEGFLRQRSPPCRADRVTTDVGQGFK